MSVHPRVVHMRRESITALPLYYSGHLHKKQTKDKTFKKFFTELRGSTLFFYKNDQEDTYIEKLDLNQVKSMEKSSTHLTLSLDTDEVKLKHEIPSQLKLLPGQMLKLQEFLNQERRKNCPQPRPPLPPRPPFLQLGEGSSSTDQELPECFYGVNRQEAVQMLQANPENGDIIIRPSTVGNDYALTLRQMTPSGPAIKNFKVTSTDSGLVIKLDTAVTVPSLHAVLEYFMEKTEHRLKPYVVSTYDTHLEPSSFDPKDTSVSSSSTKNVPKAQVAPLQRAKTEEEVQPPPLDQDRVYMIPDDATPENPTVKPATLNDELRHAVKQRRQAIYDAAEGEEQSRYERHISDRQTPSSSVQWINKTQ
ncbi:signal-transducing adaptor protein 1-like isoform X2 [Gouania willdenowi]|uniref:Signal-transducing adaptor protein 1-like n=1 Tax=Gouania willdenowi TaxID=441366 RepID=A0A8C5H0M2_GOUWI|nr:signal-transducing adaptor protein 1-like isoform X2 [Gouania willdenowi]